MGLPEESLEDVRDTLEQIMQLKPDNLTVHSLALKRAARLNMFKEDYKDYKMVNTQEHMDLTASYAKREWRETLRMSVMRKKEKREFIIF